MASPGGQWLSLARQGARLSTRGLARKAGYTAGYISKLEGGHQQQPKREVVEALADALDRPRAEALQAFGYAADPLEISAEAREFDHLLRQMHPHRRREVMNAVRSVVELASQAAV